MRRWAKSRGAENLFGETLTADAALVCSQIAIAKALTVIAAAMVESQQRADIREELEEMRQERAAR